MLTPGPSPSNVPSHCHGHGTARAFRIKTACRKALWTRAGASKGYKQCVKKQPRSQQDETIVISLELAVAAARGCDVTKVTAGSRYLYPTSLNNIPA